jgi:Glycosyl hydrolase family 26
VSDRPDGGPQDAGGPLAVADRADDAAGPAPRRRTGLLVGVLVLLVALVAGVVYVVTRPDPAPVVERPADQIADRPPGPVAEWASGAAGEGVLDGEFDEWRGAPVEITGTWADAEPELQIDLPTLRGDGAEFEDWDSSLDIGIGAIGEGETWAEAAAGAYDDRWRLSLTNLAQAWEGRSGTLYIRFAHEMNGDWYPWRVTAENYTDFIPAWQRFRALQQEIFPESQLVFCLSRESVNNEIDWRETFPGAEYVDVVGVDYYNQFPYVETMAEFREAATEVDDFGGPKGIQGYLDFAREQGLPLAVPEWSGNAGEGDSPAFIYGMYELFAREGGSGPGQIVYEILFNIEGYDDNFEVWPDTAMPNSAEQYRHLW